MDDFHQGYARTSMIRGDCWADTWCV